MADEEEETKWVCADCLGDAFLKELVPKEGAANDCSYCDNEGPTITVERLSELVEKAFEDHYYRTSDQPDGYELALLSDKEIDYNWDRHGEEVLWVIAGAVGSDEPVAEDILGILEDKHSDRESDEMGVECEFARDSYYDSKPASCEEYQIKWTEFVKSLQTETRLFNQRAQAVLSEVFANLTAHQTAGGDSVIREIGPDCEINELYRARVFEDEGVAFKEALARPWNGLGPPPSRMARRGRMNAQGIAMFYGAISSDTAIAEVRPPVGSRVVVGKFQVVRKLRLLDLKALRDLSVEGSVFDPSYLERKKLALFLDELSWRMAQPVMPSLEDTDYLPTQAVADFLASELRLDGIIYRSAQTGTDAANVVLFHHASRVAASTDSPEAEYSVHTYSSYDDGDEPDYWVSVSADSDQLEIPGPLDLLTMPSPWPEDIWATDIRGDSLSIAPSSIVVHHVNNVSVSTSSFSVRRHVSNPSNPPPF